MTAPEYVLVKKLISVKFNNIQIFVNPETVVTVTSINSLKEIKGLIPILLNDNIYINLTVKLHSDEYYFY